MSAFSSPGGRRTPAAARRSVASAARRGAALLLAAALAAGQPAAMAQIDNLPKLGDAFGDELSPQAERRLGDSIMRQVRRDGSYMDDAEIADYLSRLAATMTATPAAAGYTFEFFAIRDGTINAFALPGGWIGVHTGLFTASQSESELASVIAHEMGHVTQRHIARMLAQQKQSSMVSMAALILALLAARSSPDAAFGAAMLGETVARQNMLSFSRDAEREADRVGFEILRQGGFDTQGMVTFFGRMQQAGRLYESNAPAYMRTHPLTAERINDMQLRIKDSRYRQRPDSTEFTLLRARLRASGDTSVEGMRNARTVFEGLTRDTQRTNPAAWFGLASIAAAERSFDVSDKALAEAQRLLGAPHPYFERLAIANRLDAGDARAAADRGRQAVARFPESRALTRAYGEALVASGQGAEAVVFLKERLNLFRGDVRLWHLLAEAHGLLNQRAEAHRAAAEEYILVGAWQSAAEQLRLAQRAGDTDFYTASVIDARLREIQVEVRREIEEQRGQGPPR
jgi:predicted Zn-dependent protease